MGLEKVKFLYQIIRIIQGPDEKQIIYSNRVIGEKFHKALIKKEWESIGKPQEIVAQPGAGNRRESVSNPRLEWEKEEIVTRTWRMRELYEKNCQENKKHDNPGKEMKQYYKNHERREPVE